jgi:hypothetical protein
MQQEVRERIKFRRVHVRDLTGLFWTKQCENMSLERSLGYAEEEV